MSTIMRMAPLLLLAGCVMASAANAALPLTFKALKAEAEAGDIPAQTALGRAYADGWYVDEDVRRDVNEARLWLKTAADYGYGPAAFELGKTYEVDDVAQAVPWFLKAAAGELDAGQRASVTVRLCHAYRDRAVNDWNSALDWCAKAAETGTTAPYLAMAKAVAEGAEGQGKSLVKAVAMYTGLADRGDVTATRFLADHYVGEDAPPEAHDAGLALKYTRPAVGLAPEIYIAQLARLHATGYAMEKPDLVEAARLYQFALRFETEKAPQTEARDWLAAHPDITRAKVDARLLPAGLVTPGTLKHGFARRTVDGQTIDDLYPRKARTKGIEGLVMLECTITTDGELANCMVRSEDPQGYDFARQTLMIVSRFGLQSTTPEAFKPVAGKLVHLPFAWRME